MKLSSKYFPGQVTVALAAMMMCGAARAELKVPAIFGDNMVLQQGQANPVWGWDTAGTEVKVEFAGQTKIAKADDQGKWKVVLDALPVNAKAAEMKITGTGAKTLTNVLVGEVWLCSGQSNMGFTVGRSYDGDLEMATSRNPLIRLISVPNVGTQELQNDFNGKWEESGPDSVKEFTAVGYMYGKMLQQALGVPVGLIDNAWGGSACEAWIQRSVLDGDERFKDISAAWKKTESEFSEEAFKASQDKHKALVSAWTARRVKEQRAGRFVGNTTPPRAPQNPMTGQHRPGNLFAGCLHPIIGYGIRGAIWYQGESNSSRALEYRDLFPFMISHWREKWGQGDFPFYWVQLADYLAESPTPGNSSWAELREAQTLTMSAIKNGGQAVTIDLGEGKDIHPRNKRDVAERLARWALAKEYGQKIPYRSPEFKSVDITGNKAAVTIDTFGAGDLTTFDVAEARGFALCGEDKVWHWAQARVAGPDKVEVTSAEVKTPVAVRYAWSDNPVCNLFAKNGLPVTPFRSDSFPMVTDPKNAPPKTVPPAKK